MSRERIVTAQWINPSIVLGIFEPGFVGFWNEPEPGQPSVGTFLNVTNFLARTEYTEARFIDRRKRSDIAPEDVQRQDHPANTTDITFAVDPEGVNAGGGNIQKKMTEPEDVQTLARHRVTWNSPFDVNRPEETSLLTATRCNYSLGEGMTISEFDQTLGGSHMHLDSITFVFSKTKHRVFMAVIDLSNFLENSATIITPRNLQNNRLVFFFDGETKIVREKINLPLGAMRIDCQNVLWGVQTIAYWPLWGKKEFGFEDGSRTVVNGPNYNSRAADDESLSTPGVEEIPGDIITMNMIFVSTR